MLIQFSVKNFLSFRDSQALSLVRAKGDELAASNTFQVDVLGKASLLRSAVIYGPNASGKSNFLSALQTMRQIVMESAAELQPGEKLPVAPFRLSQAARNEPSEFEAIFITDNIRYQYGFAVTEDRVIEEWLMAFPKGRLQQWLLRTWDEEKESYDWRLGSNLAGEKKIWKATTRDNALFLSTAVQLNSEQLRPIYDWFKQTLRTVNITAWHSSYSAHLCAVDKNEKQRIVDFLHVADLGIHDVEVKEKLFENEGLPNYWPDTLKKGVGQVIQGRQTLEIKTLHLDSKGEAQFFDFKDESHGTQKMFALAGPWIDSLDNGYILFIDELNDSLHPHMLRFLVNLFNSKSNTKNAQLVFTTHETSILHQTLLRRDQIWFCEKDRENASKVYPLTDFSPRKGRENLEQAYLSGRYGSLPYVKPFENNLTRNSNGDG
ncbi:MAG: ATP-binding protein [Gammaproteobacteria bacterium]|nr:ATP-binding protein [Gammaproteobacteria bacterium]